MTTALRHLSSDAWLLFATRFIRLFAYGALSVVLVLYLVGLGLTETDTGLLLTSTLLGDTLVSLYLTTQADRIGRRRMLIVGAALMTGAGIAFAFTSQMWLLVIAGTIGVISPSGQEVGPFLPIEQAALSQVVPNRVRTEVFAWYTLAGSVATALGALAAGYLTHALQTSWAPVDSYRAVVVGYACVGVALALVASRVSPRAEAERSAEPAVDRPGFARLSGIERSRRVVWRLSALFALDSCGGGFVVQSFAAYWFYLRFGVDPRTLGTLFFAANVFAGLSALVASRLAGRIGLLNTMVVTHLPSNVLLILIPLMPTLSLAALMLLLRFSISQMDVPTRQSYTMAVVPPEERSAASGITGVARTTGAALSPLFAGLLFSRPSLINVPFFIAGALKIAYDLLLFRAFRSVKPPAQTPPSPPPPSFTAAQAESGRAAYETNCSGCHLRDLQGGFEAPQLAGANFLNQWGDKSIAELHGYLMASMPPTSPGSTGTETMTAIVAYILQANGARAGSQALTPQSAGTIRSAAGRAGTAAPTPSTPTARTPATSTFRKGLSVAGRVKNFVPVTDDMLRRPDPADWLMFRGNYQAWSYSPLKEITTANVADLELAWVWAMAEGGTQQSHPLVHDGVLYLLNPHNIVQAIDAKTGTLIWEQRAGPEQRAGQRGSRSLSIAGDKILFPGSDARMVALDARTGQLLWETRVGFPDKGHFATSGSIVINGKVLQGLSGCERFTGDGCWISAVAHVLGNGAGQAVGAGQPRTDRSRSRAVHGIDARVESRHGQAVVVLPTRARRVAGPGRSVRARARRHRRRESALHGGQTRNPVEAGSPNRQVPRPRRDRLSERLGQDRSEDRHARISLRYHGDANWDVDAGLSQH